MRRTSALALLINLDAKRPLDRSDYYVRVADILLDFAEAHSSSSDAAEVAGYAHAFSHDVLNIAALAANLLWFEDVTPDMSRTPDLVRISVDVGNYLVLLQTACDIMADVIRKFGISPKRRGQAPEESFHKLHNWAKSNPGRLAPGFETVGSDLPWFDEINGIRTKIVHRGYDVLTYTNRLFFKFGLAQPDLNFGQPREKVKLTPMLPLLKRLTLSVLEFSDGLAQAIMKQEAISPSQRHILNGVYVPALHHLQQYEPPVASSHNAIVAACLLQLRDYLTASDIGYPRGHWWLFLIKLSELLGTPIGMSMPGYAPSGALADWTLVFESEQKRVAIIVRDTVAGLLETFEAARKALFTGSSSINAFILVCRSRLKASEEMSVSYDDDVIVSVDPHDAARRVFERFQHYETANPGC